MSRRKKEKNTRIQNQIFQFQVESLRKKTQGALSSLLAVAFQLSHRIAPKRTKRVDFEMLVFCSNTRIQLKYLLGKRNELEIGK